MKPILIFLSLILIVLSSVLYQESSLRRRLQVGLSVTSDQLKQTQNLLSDLQNESQYQINQDLSETIKNIQTTFNQTVTSYEDILEIKGKSNYPQMDQLFTDILIALSQKKYASASSILKTLNQKIQAEITAPKPTIPQNIPVNNAPPESGFSKQKVFTIQGDFLVSLVGGNLSNTKIIVDTASSSDCQNDCPVKSLSDYATRNNAYAAVNGSYFCPASYPSCADKKNSFDLLLMNKDKYYFNSNNNVYSSNPAVIFGGGYLRFVVSASEWGRDTGIDGLISNFPLLVFNNENKFGGDDDPKKSAKGNRSFVANKGSQVFIGVVHNASVSDSALVLKTLGMENALNLDSGGSTALWANGYKVGPGRDIPNAVLFLRK